MTRELLSEVLDEKIVEIKPIQPSKRLLMFRVMRGKFDVIHNADINIYELANRCKEWAVGKEHRINSTTYYHTKSDVIVANANVEKLISGSFYSVGTNQGEYTEPEAIFKACEWILKQKEVEL